MTVQTQISLSDEIFNELKRRESQPEKQSALICEALNYFFETHQQTNELEQINQYAEELNQEAEDVLDYQVFR